MDYLVGIPQSYSSLVNGSTSIGIILMFYLFFLTCQVRYFRLHHGILIWRSLPLFQSSTNNCCLAGFMSCVNLHNFIPHFFRTPLTMKFFCCPTYYDTYVSIEFKKITITVKRIRPKLIFVI